MKLLIALIISLFIHIGIFFFLFEENNAINHKNDLVSLDTVKFDLGISAGLSESVIEKKVNLEEQVEAKAGVSPTPPSKSTPQKTIELKDIVNKENNAEQVVVLNKIEPIISIVGNIQEKNIVKEIKKLLPPKKITEKPVITTEKKIPFIEAQVVLPPNLVGSQTNDADKHIKQVTKDVESESLGGKALTSESTDAEASSYIATLQRKVANSANRLYPKKSKRNNQQGVIKVGFYLSENGVIERVSLIKGSEFPALNKAAIKAVKRVKKYKPLPQGLNNYFIIPINFKLR